MINGKKLLAIVPVRSGSQRVPNKNIKKFSGSNLSFLEIKLKKLKKMGVTGVKQSLEDEGATFAELKIMRKIADKAKVDLNVKIGGCEAKNDIFFCKQIKCNSIVAPMVESSYALRKFLQVSTIGNKIPLLMMIESMNTIRNLSSIINSKNFKHLSGVVFGRADLAGSMGLEKQAVNSKKVYNKVFNTLRKIKKKTNKRFVIKMGGSITPDSKDFIRRLFKKKLVQKIETRNIEIKVSEKTINNFEKIVLSAFDFEFLWLKYKLKKNIKKNRIKYNDDKKRIVEIEKRIVKFEKWIKR